MYLRYMQYGNTNSTEKKTHHSKYFYKTKKKLNPQTIKKKNW